MKLLNQSTIGACAMLAMALVVNGCGSPEEMEGAGATAPDPGQGAPAPSGAAAAAGAEQAPAAPPAVMDDALALARRVFESPDPKAAYQQLGEQDRLKVDGVTQPHSLEVSTVESEVEGAGGPDVLAYTGCYGFNQTFRRKALFGNTLYTYWQTTRVCVNGRVTSVRVTNAGGETSTPGWRIARSPTTSTLNVGWEGRGLARYYFVLGAGGWDIQQPSDCIQQLLNANGRDHRSTRSCNLHNP